MGLVILSPFMDEETQAQRNSHLPKVTAVSGGSA